jgi:thioredoxin 1
MRSHARVLIPFVISHDEGGTIMSAVKAGSLPLVAVTDANWTDEVLLAGGPVLVDFWAEWCPPCHRLRPVLEQLAAEWQGRVKVVALNTDENPNTTRDYGILGAPTLLLFIDGDPVRSIVGAQPKARIRSLLLSDAHF